MITHSGHLQCVFSECAGGVESSANFKSLAERYRVTLIRRMTRISRMLYRFLESVHGIYNTLSASCSLLLKQDMVPKDYSRLLALR